MKWMSRRRMYNFVEVSEHNLEIFQTMCFCMDFVTLEDGVWFSIRFFSFLFYSVQYLNSRNCKRLREFEEIYILRQSCTVEVTVTVQGGKLLRLFSGFHPRIRPLEVIIFISSYMYGTLLCLFDIKGNLFNIS